MKTAFVTGATGFVGTNLVGLLLAQGWRVRALCRPRADGTLPSINGVDVHAGDVADGAAVLAAMPAEPDAVFHVAASLSLWSGGKAQQDRTNVEGTRQVVAAALERGARRFIHTSSVAAYGIHEGRITEATASNASAQTINYVRTKFLAEEEVRLGIARGLPAIFLNPANIIGPHDHHGWARLFLLVHAGKLPGIPPGNASFAHAAAVAAAHLAAVDRGRPGENYLLGGADATYLELVQQIARLVGRRVPRSTIPAFVMRTFGRLSELGARFTGKEPGVTAAGAAMVSARMTCDSAKAERELGYAPRSLAEMLADAHAWLVGAGHLPAPPA
jgi:dihydroflavonol-4-reductase